MHIFAGFQKVQPQTDGTLLAYGVASAPVRDAHGEVVTKEAMADAITEYMNFPAVREMHSATKAAGTGIEISLDDEGKTVFVAKIVDKDAIEKIRHRVYRGFSIGGKVVKRNPQDFSIISKIELQEISLVDRPSCPAATLDLWKRDDVTDLNKAGDTGVSDTSVWTDKEKWDDGFDFFGEGGDRGRSSGPMSTADGGPYRSQTPIDQSDDGRGAADGSWHGRDQWDDGREFFGQGGDPGKGQFVTNPNAGQVRTQGTPNSTVNTAQGSGDTGNSADIGVPGGLAPSPGASSSRRRGGGASPSTDYFTPNPNMNANLQRLFGMIEEMYTAQAKAPPVEGAELLDKGLTNTVADQYSEEGRPNYIERRKFTADQRKAAAKSGAAMKDGSYPIHNRSDLANAIRAIGRSKNPGATKAHIKRRAASLGASSMVPSDWGKSAESEGALNNGMYAPGRQRTPAQLNHIDGNNDSLATKLSKTDDLLANTLASVEKMEVRFHRGHATPEAYRLAKIFKEMPVDELAEVLALDAMASIAKNDVKVTTAEDLAKRYKEDNDTLLAKLNDTQNGLEALSARVQKLAEMPLPTKTAGSIHALGKEGDSSGALSITTEDLAKARKVFDDMTEDERVMMLTKVALSHPRKMNLNPLPNPPRSEGGGTAGRPDGQLR